MGGYEEIWQHFRQAGELEFGGHTDPAWRHGHTTSASFVVRVDANALCDRLKPVRELLQCFPFVSMHPDDLMHITLLMLGFPVSSPRSGDEISHEKLRELEDRARSALSGASPFIVRLSNLNAFPSAVFVETHSGGRLERLQELLSTECGMKRPLGPPHLTLAYFHAPEGSPVPESLVDAIGGFRDWYVGEVWVDHVELTLLDLRSARPELRSAGRVPLAAR
ncbi:2'-5' RNA ligase family protein [Rubrobacter calidifluminis]|uniref:2'-5' RNA ligase family protein n=1 Tax=Rubrobacter calidifluminis TaxID=1392640 RepID=UPI002361EA98|nr:2'-5' RNA ligase family protein [Rubrobacter calidifluminis]